MMSDAQRQYHARFNRNPWRPDMYFTEAGNLFFDPRTPVFSSLAQKTNAAMRRICNIAFRLPVVIYGPAGSGKTRNAEALRKLFGKARVIEMQERTMGGVIPNDALILTNDIRWASEIGSGDLLPVVHIVTALRAIGISSN